jgi:DNA-binding Lrp family transcriptional regulator
MRKIDAITTDEWFKEVFPTQKERPKGYYTVGELAEKSGINLRTMIDRVKTLLRAGLLDQIKVKVNGRLCNVYKPHNVKKVKKFLYK